MPETHEHAALIELFRQEPELVTWLVERFAGVEIPAEHSSSATDPLLKVVNLAPDVAVLVRDSHGKLVLALPVEVQRDKDPEKRYTWPCYEALIRERFRCPTHVLVIALRKDVAEWARQPIVHGTSVMYVIVLGPEDIPRITDLAEARANPALAVLSAAIHARFADGHRVSRAAVEALTCLPDAHLRVYSPLVFGNLSQAAIHVILEDIMQEHQENPRQEEGIGYEATMEILLDLRARSRDEGALRNRAAMLLRLLDRRALAVDEATRARVTACEDAVQLEAWFDRAVVASCIDEVFA